MAEKKYPGNEEGLKKLKESILAGKGPKATGTTVSSAKLTFLKGQKKTMKNYTVK